MSFRIWERKVQSVLREFAQIYRIKTELKEARRLTSNMALEYLILLQ
jgi:hypothetical protein